MINNANAKNNFYKILGMVKDNGNTDLEKRVEIIKRDWTWLTEYSVMDHLVLYYRDRKFSTVSWK